MRDLHATIVHKQYAIYWKELGSKLGLANHRIEIISNDNKYNPSSTKDCCIAMLEEWLARDVYLPTWGKLSDAINEIEVALKTGNNNVLHSAYDRSGYFCVIYKNCVKVTGYLLNNFVGAKI